MSLILTLFISVVVTVAVFQGKKFTTKQGRYGLYVRIERGVNVALGHIQNRGGEKGAQNTLDDRV